ncbi:unnamed protein product, partial [Staurois parvus]
MFDPVFSNPSIFPGSLFHLPVEHSLEDTLHMLSLMCTARVFFFFSWERACDQHKANQHCPDRGSG